VTGSALAAGDVNDDACTLLSTTCTTGWFDWVHGDLWLCPSGLLRESRGLRATVIKALGRPFRAGASRRPRGRLDRDQVAASGRGVTWVGWDEIARVTLKAGIIDHSLHIERVDRRRVKFLWLAGDGDFELLMAVLRAALGDRLVVHRFPIG
jgi:hypothetical protein